MMSDITFGQFIDTNSFIHKLDPRSKLIFLIAYIVFIFVADNFLSLSLLAILLLTSIFVSKIPIKMYFKNIKAVLPIIILTALLNIFYTDGGRVLFLIIEKIRKKPVPAKTEALVNSIGFMLLMLLMVYVTFNDILRLF